MGRSLPKIEEKEDHHAQDEENHSPMSQRNTSSHDQLDGQNDVLSENGPNEATWRA